MTSDDQFQTFAKFEEKTAASDLTGLLKKNNIEYLMEDIDMEFDTIFSSNKVNGEFRIKIKKQDFEKADALLAEASSPRMIEIKQAESDYYLFAFTDEELLDLVAKRDQWSNHDFKLALSILNDRGKTVSTEELERLKISRLEELSQPESHNQLWIYVGYLSALAGGFFGMLIGWYLINAKKTLPGGREIFAFAPSGRKHGRIILIIGLAIFITLAARQILKDINH